MSKLFEYRTYAEFEVRTDPEEPGFSGYASHFWDADSYYTAVAPGAFRKTLKERGDRLPVLWQHDPSKPIGRHRTIKEDRQGLAVDVALVDDGAEGTTSLSRLRGGVPLGLSFGFQTIKDRSAEDDDPIVLDQLPGAKKSDIRVITEVRLFESSVVTFPANEAATITGVRSELEIDALSTLLDAIKAGELDEARADLVQQIVAAAGLRAGAGPDHSTPDKARRQRDIDARLALVNYRGFLSGVTP